VHYDIDSAYFFSYFDNIGEDGATEKCKR